MSDKQSRFTTRPQPGQALTRYDQRSSIIAAIHTTGTDDSSEAEAERLNEPGLHSMASP